METTAAYRSIGPQYEKKCSKISDETDAWFLPEAAANKVGLRVAPLGAVVTHKDRIITTIRLIPARLEEKKGA